MRISSYIVSLAILAMPGVAHAEGGLTIEKLVDLNRVSDPQMAPDGKTVAYVMRETDRDANTGRTDIWLVDARDPSEQPIRVTSDKAGDWQPRWDADGDNLYFLSSRTESTQVWRYSVDHEALTQVTDLPLGVSNLVVAPKNTHLAFTMEVYPDCDDLACTVSRNEVEAERQSTGRVYDRLLYRHWDKWEDHKQTQLFVQPLNGEGLAQGDVVNISGVLNGDVAAIPFGDTSDIAFTPDGGSIFFSLRLADHGEAWSTNYDIYRAPTSGGEVENLTADNKAYDARPVVSRDGRWLAYQAMKVPGYESDRKRIVMLNLRTGERRVVTENWDRSVGSHAFLNGNAILIATAGHLGQDPLWAINARSGSATRLTSEGSVTGFSIGNSRIAYTQNTLGNPADIFVTTGDGRKPRRLTSVNADKLADTEMGAYQQYSFDGWNGEKVYGYVMNPAGFEEGQTYPVAYIIHGGPQGSFGNYWSYRWNPQVYAAAGYGVVFIDFHGSTGYGQDFTNAINQDWGGKPLEDWKKGLSAALENNAWLDGDNVCALGASYGGYAMSWISGKWPDRFQCIVNHAGVSELRSMYYSTEELWFVEHDFGGPYFENAEVYERHNPFQHVKNWKTPMLVIQGGKDYRVPEHQSMATFTALQRQGVPSRFVYFPDENHHILQPANAIQWHDEVVGWLDKWLK